MGIHQRVHSGSRLHEALNRLADRDMGNSAASATQIRWTQYNGQELDPHTGAVLSSNNHTLKLRNTAGKHLAVLLSPTAAGAVPTAANSVLLVEDAGLFVGAGKQLRVYGAAGSGYSQLTSDNNGLATLGGSGSGAAALALNVVLLGGAPSTSGSIRLSNNTAIEARNVANSADIALVATDASNSVVVGDGTNAPATVVTAATSVLLRIGATDRAVLNATSLTLTDNLLFSADATYDVGAFATTRPRDVNLSRDVNLGRDVSLGRDLRVAGHLLGTGSTPSIVAGPGAGTGAGLAVSVTGTDNAGTVVVATGAVAPAANAVIATITFATTFPAPPSAVLLTGADGNARALSGTGQVWIDYASSDLTTTTWRFRSNVALAAATAYRWYVAVIG